MGIILKDMFGTKMAPKAHHNQDNFPVSTGNMKSCMLFCFVLLTSRETTKEAGEGKTV